MSTVNMSKQGSTPVYDIDSGGAQFADVNGLSPTETFNTPIEEITSAESFLLFVAIDQSGSMNDYRSEMADALMNFKDSIENSKESDLILVSRANFDNRVSISGYKPINNFDSSYDCGGCTCLYDAIVSGKDKLVEYMDLLKKNGMHVRAVFSVFSDGEDTDSNRSLYDARDAISELKKREIGTAIICFGSEAENIGNQIGFKEVLNVRSSASELRKAFNMLSKSAITASKAAGAAHDTFKF